MNTKTLDESSEEEDNLPDYTNWNFKPATSISVQQDESDEEESSVPNYENWEYKKSLPTTTASSSTSNEKPTSPTISQPSPTSTTQLQAPSSSNPTNETTAEAKKKTNKTDSDVTTPNFDFMKNLTRQLLAESKTKSATASTTNKSTTNKYTLSFDEEGEETSSDEESLDYTSWKKKHYSKTTKPTQTTSKGGVTLPSLEQIYNLEEKEDSLSYILKKPKPQMTKEEHMQMLQWMFPFATVSKNK